MSGFADLFFMNWKKVSGAPQVHVSNSLLSYHWPGAGTGNAPDPSTFDDFIYGADQDAVGAAGVYYVVNGAWVPLNVTVTQLHGG